MKKSNYSHKSKPTRQYTGKRKKKRKKTGKTQREVAATLEVSADMTEVSGIFESPVIDTQKLQQKKAGRNDSSPQITGVTPDNAARIPDIQRQIDAARYPNLHKANNTKIIVIGSLAAIAVIFVLSVLFPGGNTDISTEDSQKDTAISSDNPENGIDHSGDNSIIDHSGTDSLSIGNSVIDSEVSNSDHDKTTSDSEASNSDQGKPAFDSEASNSDQGKPASDSEAPISDHDKPASDSEASNSNQGSSDTSAVTSGDTDSTDAGTIITTYGSNDPDTGWKEINGALRYVRNDGKIAKSCWIDGRYVGASGALFTCAVTPDGTYVDADGYPDNSLGAKDSTRGMNDLMKTLNEMIKGYSGEWSVYVKDIGHNVYMSINNKQHYSASLIKLYCAAAAYDLMDKGTLEETETIDSLMWQMIAVSDNDAFNLMVMNCAENHNHVTGRGVIQEYIDREGYQGTTITSILVPSKYTAPSSPGRNYTTVEDCGLLLEKIYKRKCVSKKASEDFLSLLLDQQHVNKIPSGLPEGTKCANKTGDTDEVQHDAAIVYSPGGDYIIVVMSTGCGAAIPNIQNISEAVYNYFN